MGALIVLLLAVAPGILWLILFYLWDQYEPEPVKLVVRTFFLGILACIPAFFLELPFGGSEFLVLVVVAPIVEELLKFSVVFFTMYRHPELDEPMDGVVYGAAAALGFATGENPLYLIGTYLTSQESGASFASVVGAVGGVFIIRAYLTVPGHALWSIMWGYALGRAKFKKEGSTFPIIALGILAAITFHGLHNLTAAYGAAFAALGLIALAALLWVVVRRMGASALADSPFKPGAVPAQTDPIAGSTEDSGSKESGTENPDSGESS